MPLIDAHLHQWDPSAVAYNWLLDAPPALNERHLVEDIEESVLGSGVTGAILVQAADSREDTEAMLGVARSKEWITGVIAWAPLDDPSGMRQSLDEFAAEPLVVGVRSLIHDRADGGWILSDAVQPGLRSLAEAGLAFDFVTSSPAALAQVPLLAASHPELTIVVDHLGKPPVTGTPTELGAWREAMIAAARHPRVLAKASGLYGDQGEPDRWSRSQVRRILDVALDCFGPERIMLGSDWPVCEIAGGHGRVWGALVAEIDMLAPTEREAVRWQTARAAYLETPRARLMQKGAGQ